jgi:hypothetical protein
MRAVHQETCEAADRQGGLRVRSVSGLRPSRAHHSEISRFRLRRSFLRRSERSACEWLSCKALVKFAGMVVERHIAMLIRGTVFRFLLGESI